MLEKIDDANGIRGFPGIFEGNFRRNVLEAGLQIDAAFFFELEESESDECFADGADAEFGVASDVAILREVRFADAAAPEDGAVADESDACARNVV